MNKIDRLMKKIFPEPNTGCWIWTGGSHGHGYGTLSPKCYNGFMSPHRFMYFHKNGEFDRGLFVLHSCDLPCCVNPDHLFLGTAKDNTDDARKKQRLCGMINSPKVNRQLKLKRLGRIP